MVLQNPPIIYTHPVHCTCTCKNLRMTDRPTDQQTFPAAPVARNSTCELQPSDLAATHTTFSRPLNAMGRYSDVHNVMVTEPLIMHVLVLTDTSLWQSLRHFRVPSGVKSDLRASRISRSDVARHLSVVPKRR